VTPAVEKVNYEPDQKPNDQSVPVLCGNENINNKQSGFQESDEWDKWRTERALRIGVGSAHDQDGAADNHEGEQVQCLSFPPGY